VGLEAQGDAFFPDWGTTAFKKAFKTKEEGPWQQSAQGNGVGYRFLRFKRKSSKIRIGAIVLAAGQGSRMGNRPKPLILVDGQPLITRILDQLRAAGVDHIGVVLGHYADQIMPIVAASDVQLLHNPAPGQGQASSQKIGLSWLPADCDAAMVVLADQPSLTKDDLRDLICRFKKRAAGVDMVYPVVDGSPGNPVMISAVLAKFLAGQDPPIEGRAWRAAHQAACLAFETKNRHYIEDLDTDDDLTDFQAASGISLTRP
jgi:CTP:molybdopterin cytidylyltransferase MocA